MRATGIVRRMDMLGRVVIPKEIRNVLKINFGDPIEVYTEKDEIILKRYSPVFNLESTAENITGGLNKLTGHSAFVCDKDVFVAGAGRYADHIVGKKIPKRVEEIIADKKTLTINADSGNLSERECIALIEGEYRFFNQSFCPILNGDECIGLVILCDDKAENTITPSDAKLASLGAEFIAAKV